VAAVESRTSQKKKEFLPKQCSTGALGLSQQSEPWLEKITSSSLAIHLQRKKIPVTGESPYEFTIWGWVKTLVPSEAQVIAGKWM